MVLAGRGKNALGTSRETSVNERKAVVFTHQVAVDRTKARELNEMSAIFSNMHVVLPSEFM
jgi:hypothetical protein